MLSTELTRTFGLKHPIVSAPMANWSGGVPVGHLGWGGFHHLPNQSHHSMNPESRANFGEFPFHALRCIKSTKERRSP
jgi:hypothetical protein